MNPVLKVVIAMFIWGSLGIFVKSIDMPSIEVVFLRSIIACVCIFIYQLIKNKGKDMKPQLSKKNGILLIILGVLLSFNWLFLFQAYKYTTITNATISYYLAPVFILLFSPIVLKEKITFKKIISIIIAMLGLILIISNQAQGEVGNYNHYIGITYGVIAAISYACIVFINKKISNVSSFDRTFYQIFVATLILIPIVLVRQKIFIPNLKVLLIILILGVVHTGLTYVLYFSSFEFISAQKLSLLSFIDPVSAVIFGTLFLGESLSVFHVIGGIMILACTLLPQE